MTEVFQQGELERSQRRAHNPNDVGSNPTPATISSDPRSGNLMGHLLEQQRAEIRAENGGAFLHAQRAAHLEAELSKAADSIADWKYIAACCFVAYVVCALTKDWFAGGAIGLFCGIAVAIRVEGRRMRRNREQ